MTPARRGGAGPAAAASSNGHQPRRPDVDGGAGPTVAVGRCRCGLPAGTACTGGCGRPTCGEHLLNRASRLGWPGPYRSEREHTVYLRAFWADAAPLCTWCREEAGRAAVAALPPVPPLPHDVVERLGVLLRRPHDYPGDAWSTTVRDAGGAAAILRRLTPTLWRRRTAQEFPGRRRGEALVGVAIAPAGTRSVYELVDGAGVAWTVRPLGPGVVRKRRAWAWERTADARLDCLLAGLVELAQGGRPEIPPNP